MAYMVGRKWTQCGKFKQKKRVSCINSNFQPLRLGKTHFEVKNVRSLVKLYYTAFRCIDLQTQAISQKEQYFVATVWVNIPDYTFPRDYNSAVSFFSFFILIKWHLLFFYQNITNFLWSFQRHLNIAQFLRFWYLSPSVCYNSYLFDSVISSWTTCRIIANVRPFCTDDCKNKR